MNDLRQTFLADSLSRLAKSQTTLKEDFNEEHRRELFRTIHTIKGGAQTFGLKNPATLADQIENILATRESLPDQKLLLEGVELLADSLLSIESNLPADFIEKLSGEARRAAQSEILMTRIPPSVFKSFSESEKNATISALRRGEHILCAEVGFEPADFADRYRNLRKILCEKSEIIAALPSAKFKSAGKIGFQLFLASRETAESLQKTVESFGAQISSHACGQDVADDLFEMLSQIAAHGETIAAQCGKILQITTLTNEPKLSGEKRKAVFDILLHLVRNAVDHAIEKTGNIEVQLFDETDGLHLTVTDDGKGVELAKVRARAVEKNLISDDDMLSDPQLLDLIFAPEFSTLDSVTEFSGRGVGLDAVKNSVERMNGKISVKSRKTLGTTFEIFLPN